MTGLLLMFARLFQHLHHDGSPMAAAAAAKHYSQKHDRKGAAIRKSKRAHVSSVEQSPISVPRLPK